MKTEAVGSNTRGPFADARIVWHFRNLRGNENYALPLKTNGKVLIGQELLPRDREQSLERGGDGYAAIFSREGWLSLDVNRARTLRPEGDAVSLCVRAWIGPEGNGALFFSDFMALAIHPHGLAVGYLGVATPQGKVYRELPLAVVERDRWLDLVVRVGDGRLDFFCNGTLRSTIPVDQRLCSPFDDELWIGALNWSGPDLFEYEPVGFQDGRIDTVALWERSLADSEVAFLSGASRVTVSETRNPLDQALLEYNAFFDTSIDRDVERCGRLWQSLRGLADRDPRRPIYHLTQPLGHIFDPVGAYWHGGNYHVFSYRDIFALLRYCSLDHYVSPDLVHWTGWPVGPWADSDLDVYAIWLMNHFVDDEGCQRVMYTGHGKFGKHGIMARSTDGLVSFTDKKAVLTKYHHDGHVWRENGAWFTITSRLRRGTQPGNRGDGVMLWSSSDLERWTELGEIFAQPKYEGAESWGDREGFMEFPYLLRFGDKDVLILGGHPVRYWVGRFDLEARKFVPDTERGQLLDQTNPFHCYNPLCVDRRGEGGAPRRIVMAMYQYLGGGSDTLLPWNGVHVMPRVLTFDGERLRQEPVPEMESLRRARYSQPGIAALESPSARVAKRGDAVEIVAELDPGDAARFGLKVLVSGNGSSFVRIFFDAGTGELGVDGNAARHSGRGPSYLPRGKPVRMRIFLDRQLVEVFVNGQTCTTSGLDRGPDCTGIEFFSEGGSARCTKLEIWEMNPAGPA